MDTDGEVTKKRRRYPTEEERKGAARERKRKYAAKTVHLGSAFEEWKRQKQLCGMTSTSEFALYLLARHNGRCVGLPGSTIRDSSLATEALVTRLEDGEVKMKKRRYSTEEERKAAEKQRKLKYSAKKVYFGPAFGDWERQKMLCGFTSRPNADFVHHLLVGLQYNRHRIPVHDKRTPGKSTYRHNAMMANECIGGGSRNDALIQYYWCEPCQQYFSDTETKQHILSHFKGKLDHCAQCVEGFPTVELVEEHVLKHMGLTINVLQSEGVMMKHFEVRFNESLSLEGQPLSLFDTQKPPGKCGEELESWQVGKHCQEHNQETPYKRVMCAKYFETHEILSEYGTELCDKLTHKCGSCRGVFRSKEALKEHELVHRKTCYICDKCGNEYQYASALSNHMYTHTGLWPYTCAVCGQGCSYKAQLTTHMVIHSDVRSHICQTCGKGFPTRSYLKSHKAVHREDRPFQCSTCGKTSKTKAAAKAHEDCHTAERKYECTVCRLGYKYRAALGKHMKTAHSSERNHKCSQCGKQFYTKSVLQRHMLTHTKERPYKCEMCGDGFQQKGHLVTHMMRHTGEWSHKCSRCGKGFGNPGHLSKHMEHQHPS